MINQKTRLNMVIGYPLEHSQSPRLHNSIYQFLNMNVVLLAFQNKKLLVLIKTIKTLSIELTAVTMPYKEKIIKYLDECSDEVKILKAANTIIQRDGKLYGYNTDVNGIEYALDKTLLNKKNVLIMGAGGAARAAAFVCQKKGAQIFWLNRTKNKAYRLTKIFGGCVIDFDEIEKLSIDVIINTTPLGMYPNKQVSPLPNYKFKPNQTVFDMVYNPIETKLIKQAKKYKSKTISGLDMFIGQGLRQIELLTDKKISSQKLINTVKKLLIGSQK